MLCVHHPDHNLALSNRISEHIYYTAPTSPTSLVVTDEESSGTGASTSVHGPRGLGLRYRGLE